MPSPEQSGLHPPPRSKNKIYPLCRSQRLAEHGVKTPSALAPMRMSQWARTGRWAGQWAERAGRSEWQKGWVSCLRDVRSWLGRPVSHGTARLRGGLVFAGGKTRRWTWGTVLGGCASCGLRTRGPVLGAAAPFMRRVAEEPGAQALREDRPRRAERRPASHIRRQHRRRPQSLFYRPLLLCSCCARMENRRRNLPRRFFSGNADYPRNTYVRLCLLRLASAHGPATGILTVAGIIITCSATRMACRGVFVSSAGWMDG